VFSWLKYIVHDLIVQDIFAEPRSFHTAPMARATGLKALWRSYSRVRHKSGDQSDSAENRQNLSALGTQTGRHAFSGTMLNRALISRPQNGRFWGRQCNLLKSGCATFHFYVAHPGPARLTQRFVLHIDAKTNEASGRKEIVFEPAP
jgi:hypothetical protein